LDAVLGHGPQLQEGSVLLKFLVETRLKSKSFESLIGFQGFLVQKLSQKNKI